MLYFIRKYPIITRSYLRHYSQQQPLIQLKNATIHRYGVKEPVFQNLTLSIERDQRLVIVGPVNAGKTTLAETLAGRHSSQPLSSIEWPLINKNDVTCSPYPSDHIRFVSFKEESGVFNYNQHYYQERFNFSDPDNDLTLMDYLDQQHQQNSMEKKNMLYKVADQLDLTHLLPLSFVKLSNGQTRRARIARALLRQPKMLILDEPLMGLDVDHRKRLLALLGQLSKENLPVILVSRPQDEIPEWATDVVVLDDRKIVWQGPPDEYIAHQQQQMQAERQEKAAYRAQALLKEQHVDRPGIVELNQVNVIYSGNKILDNISWKVKEGDRWALLGPNGSGKTTLLSFLTGDHPQAYANDLTLFGRRRGTGESIWEIKQKVGLVSPEIHLYFNPTMTGMMAAGTGFYDVMAQRSLDDTQMATIERLFTEFGINHDCLHRRLQDMSSGEQRMVLLVRSLVKQPPLIIWDEPFQGLDAAMIHKVNNWLEHYLHDSQTLIMVTHHEDEIPRAVTKRFHLGPHGTDDNHRYQDSK